MDDVAQRMNEAHRNNFAGEVGLVVESVTKERVVGTLEIQPRHLQPFGIVHGGVYCTIVESLASLGSVYNTIDQGRACAGIENHTSFLRSISSGTVTGVAVAVNIGRTTHLWEVDIRDEKERLVAKGTVRLAVLEPRPTA
jgi:1,4-dihydroxy-2-naphthoyl-CoA hydrolase